MKLTRLLSAGLLLAAPLSAEYVEIGSGTSALLNRPFCGS